MAKLKEYFEPFILHRIGEGEIKNTICGYRRLLKCLQPIEEKEISQLTKNDDVYVRIEGRKHGTFGEQKSIVLFRSLLGYIEDQGIQIPFNWMRIKVPHPQEESKDQHYLTEAEFESFVEKLPNTFYGLRDRVLYELLWSTGLRIGEAVAIDEKDIDFAEGKPPEDRNIFVHTEKGGLGNKVHISDRLERWLREYLKRKPGHEALFVNFYLAISDFTRLTVSTADINLASYRKKFGIKEIEHPSFRRGFATHVAENGAHIKEVQYLMRHKSERTTLREYIKIDMRRVKNVHHRIYSQAPKTEMVEMVTNILKKNEGLA